MAAQDIEHVKLYASDRQSAADYRASSLGYGTLARRRGRTGTTG
jgi:hypothetical protein